MACVVITVCKLRVVENAGYFLAKLALSDFRYQIGIEFSLSVWCVQVLVSFKVPCENFHFDSFLSQSATRPL